MDKVQETALLQRVAELEAEVAVWAEYFRNLTGTPEVTRQRQRHDSVRTATATATVPRHLTVVR